MGSIKDTFNNLAGWQKFVLFVILIVVIYYIWKFGAGFVNGIKTNAQAKGEIEALESQGIKASYTKSKYVQLADDLESAIAGAGTDEQAVYDVFNQMKNDIDVLELDKAFGVRDEEDLKQWLRGDLSSSEMSTVNNILAKKNISKRF